MSAQDKAADLLAFYLRSAWEAAGLNWSGDNEAEVRNLVDWLGAAAEDAAREVIREQAERADDITCSESDLT